MIRHRPTVALIDLDAVRHNVGEFRRGGVEVMAVVKANGYGHGALPVARAALAAGATWLGVSMVEEGVQLRDAGIAAPILVLSEFPRGSEKEALAAGLTPSLYTEEGLARLAEAAGSFGGDAVVHVKVDTGMHRVGLPPERAPAFVQSVLGAGLELQGLWTHFATSEELDDEFTDVQLGRFRGTVERLKAAGVRPEYLHAANTAAALARPETRLDMVRVGLGVYGLLPAPALSAMADLRPAMAWRSAVTMTKRVQAGEAISYGQRYRLDREATIATVPVGYADGYSRTMGDAAVVLIRGRRYRVAGTVTMDQVMVDCGDDPVEVGDEVCLLGRQGGEELAADDLAGWMGTINYEVVCMVSGRVPREYLGGEWA